MKKYFWIYSFAVLVVFTVTSIAPGVCFAWKQKYQEELTDNPKLAEANKLYKKAIHQIKYGDGVHEPQRAVERYAKAEAYLGSTVDALDELGHEYNLDVTKEIEFCEKLNKETHSKYGMAKRE